MLSDHHEDVKEVIRTGGTDEELIEAATTARNKAYARYSGYYVGAAVFDERGATHVSCNVENAAYPLGSCAEAGAIAAMVLAGERSIAEIVVVTDWFNELKRLVPAD